MTTILLHKNILCADRLTTTSHHVRKGRKLAKFSRLNNLFNRLLAESTPEKEKASKVFIVGAGSGKVEEINYLEGLIATHLERVVTPQAPDVCILDETSLLSTITEWLSARSFNSDRWESAQQSPSYLLSVAHICDSSKRVEMVHFEFGHRAFIRINPAIDNQYSAAIGAGGEMALGAAFAGLEPWEAVSLVGKYCPDTTSREVDYIDFGAIDSNGECVMRHFDPNNLDNHHQELYAKGEPT